MFGKTKSIHMVGIGGIGMSGIAEFLFNQGFTISGSDIKASATTHKLSKLGIKVTIGHSKQNIPKNTDIVVFSSAVKQQNVELLQAESQNIPIIKRAQMLAEIMRMRYGIAISGTHGKTTTTSLVGFMLREAGLSPTIIVGGIADNFGSSSLSGSGDYIVVEADEYDRTFLSLSPIIAGITNIELEHRDCYKDLDELKDAFCEFANKTPFFGTVIACLEDEGVQAILPEIKREVITYGFSRQADFRAESPVMKGFATKFNLWCRGKAYGEVELNLLGRHNVLNSLLAIALGFELGIEFSTIKRSLKNFTGVKRRLQKLGEKHGVLFFDDYGHHPTEIKTTLAGLRGVFRNRIVVLFQPHLFSRTRDFAFDFGRSFMDADVVFIAPIYAAREKKIPGVSAKLIYDAAIKSGHHNAFYIESNDKICQTVSSQLKEGDILISFGAGDIYLFNEQIIQDYKK